MISIPDLTGSPVALILVLASIGGNIYQGLINSRLANKQSKAADAESQDAALNIVSKREAIFQGQINAQDKDLEVKRKIIEQKDIQLASLEKQLDNTKLLIENRSPQLEEFIKGQTETNRNISEVVLFFKDYITKNSERMESIVTSQSQHTVALNQILNILMKE